MLLVRPTLWIVVVFLLFAGTNAVAQSALTPTQKRAYALELLKEYDPEGWYVITQVNQLAKENPFDRYAEEHSHVGVRTALGTMVHELNHVYSAFMGWKMRSREKTVHLCYYISDTTHLLVKTTQVFPTDEMGSRIRPELRTFRFKTYVYNPTEKIKLSSNILGIYGLMDEWNAYYHGTRIDVYMYKWYQNHTKGTAQDWHMYFSNVGSVITAYVEFKFYCLAYLLYAQKNHPEMYAQILKNENFVRVFQALDRQYGDLIAEYQIIKQTILRDLQANGASVSEDDEWIMINGRGTGNFSKEYKVLQKEMNLPAYQAMLKNLQASAGASNKSE